MLQDFREASRHNNDIEMIEMVNLFRLNEVTELIGEYTAVVARSTLIACAAHAQLREMTDSEIMQIATEISDASDRFVAAYRKKLAQKGTMISKAVTDKLKSDLNEQIMSECWMMLQQVTEEVKRQIQIEETHERITRN